MLAYLEIVRRRLREQLPHSGALRVLDRDGIIIQDGPVSVADNLYREMGFVQIHLRRCGRMWGNLDGYVSAGGLASILDGLVRLLDFRERGAAGPLHLANDRVWRLFFWRWRFNLRRFRFSGGRFRFAVRFRL